MFESPPRGGGGCLPLLSNRSGSSTVAVRGTAAGVWQLAFFVGRLAQGKETPTSTLHVNQS